MESEIATIRTKGNAHLVFVFTLRAFPKAGEVGRMQILFHWMDKRGHEIGEPTRRDFVPDGPGIWADVGCLIASPAKAVRCRVTSITQSRADIDNPRCLPAA